MVAAGPPRASRQQPVLRRWSGALVRRDRALLLVGTAGRLWRARPLRVDAGAAPRTGCGRQCPGRDAPEGEGQGTGGAVAAAGIGTTRPRRPWDRGGKGGRSVNGRLYEHAGFVVGTRLGC